MNAHVTNIYTQRGAALIIGLTLLMALTIIGIGTLNTTSLEHRMVGNMADAITASNAAESALIINTGPIVTHPIFKKELPDCDDYPTPPCNRNIAVPNWWNVTNWWAANMGLTIQENRITGSATPPALVIEDIAMDRDTIGRGFGYSEPSHYRYYRVTARATGLSSNTQAIIQQTVVKRIN